MLAWRGLAIALSLTFAVATTGFAQTASIDWHVADRFRLFLTPATDSTHIVVATPDAEEDFLVALDADETAIDAPGADPVVSRITLFRAIVDQLRGTISGVSFAADDHCDHNGAQPQHWYEATAWRGAGPALKPRGLFQSSPCRKRSYAKDYLYPDTYYVRADVPDGDPRDRCTWRGGAAPDPASFDCSKTVVIPIAAYADHRGGASAQITVQVTRDGAPLGSPASADVTLGDRLFIGLGDSVGAGEGNPDLPQHFGDNFQAKAETYFRNNSDPAERWWHIESILETITPAQWWDPTCHRSLYSYQVVASLLYAASHRHDAVTFASFACSGAQTLDGLLAPQHNPPGDADFGWPGGHPYPMTSQIDDALQLLCRGSLADAAQQQDLTVIGREMGLTDQAAAALPKAHTQALCKDGRPARPVDAVMLVIGGNDIGFAGAVKNAILPTEAADPVGQIALAMVRGDLQVTPNYLAHRQADYGFASSLPETDKALRGGLAPGPTPIFAETYPNPLRLTATTPCGGFVQSQLFDALDGMFVDWWVQPPGRWRMSVSQVQDQDLQDGLVAPLNWQIENANNSDPNWAPVHYSDAPGDLNADDDFVGHGWCGNGSDRQSATSQPRFEFPALKYTGKGDDHYIWWPSRPQDWDAYAPNDRYFRTGNDVVLTQIGSHKALLQIASLHLADNIINHSFFATSGMIHPTAQGHMTMALRLLKAMDQRLPASPAGSPGS